MRIRAGAIPVPDRSAKLKPVDFSEVLLAVPDDCVLIGGAAHTSCFVELQPAH